MGTAEKGSNGCMLKPKQKCHKMQAPKKTYMEHAEKTLDMSQDNVALPLMISLSFYDTDDQRMRFIALLQ